MADYFTHFSCTLDLGTADKAVAALDLFLRLREADEASDDPAFSGFALSLQDDPGSSVLTLTSKGMVDRWRSPYDHWKRIVALWKDRDGPARELDLGDSDALLLNVDVVERGEWSADGRKAIRHELLLRESVNINAEM